MTRIAVLKNHVYLFNRHFQGESRMDKARLASGRLFFGIIFTSEEGSWGLDESQRP